ncbi:hypothetical protein BGZ95_011507 [Linnemannia exigua]|uniref:Uncharacterized protein n=1 Tax=Linnemannia exigua TaxID=604196 RepID=A0AAD4D9V0_9FUNG|nr:hypothetical protein BGZ95_011507 [Linnemannia exigua]
MADVLEFLSETALNAFNPTTFVEEPKVITSRGDYRLELQGMSTFYPFHYILVVQSNKINIDGASAAVAICYVHKRTPAQFATTIVAALEGSADDYCTNNNKFQTDYVISYDGITMQVFTSR